MQLIQGDAGAAERMFREAIVVARRDHAKSFELRAAIGLSRLWQRESRAADARALLGGVYDWFREGFETADLRAAKSLLATL